MSAGILPSLAIGACAFGAGELIFKSVKKDQIVEQKSLYEILKEAKENNYKIEEMIPKIEDEKMKKDIKEINESVVKIISTVEKNPNKINKVQNFFGYYLPITLNILHKYDEIENQRLTSADSEKFMKQTQQMIEKINNAFKNQLDNLYQTDIIDTDAEMKVFESMLQMDGYDTSNDFKKITKEDADSEK